MLGSITVYNGPHRQNTAYLDVCGQLGGDMVVLGSDMVMFVFVGGTDMYWLFCGVLLRPAGVPWGDTVMMCL